MGHIVSKQGIATDPKKIQAIHEWPRPRQLLRYAVLRVSLTITVNLSRGTLRLLDHCMSLSLVKTPNEKHQRVNWDARCEASFEALKKICSDAPVLAYADYTKPSSYIRMPAPLGFGAVLYQKQDDGKERVIAYASRTLNKAERNYDAHKLEFLSLKWGYY